MIRLLSIRSNEIVLFALSVSINVCNEARRPDQPYFRCGRALRRQRGPRALYLFHTKDTFCQMRAWIQVSLLRRLRAVIVKRVGL